MIHAHHTIPSFGIVQTRLESVILGEVTRKLNNDKKLPATREFASWMRLATSAMVNIDTWTASVELQDVVGPMIPNQRRDAFELLTNVFVGNGLLDKVDAQRMTLGGGSSMMELAPFVLRKAMELGKIDLERSHAFLEVMTVYGSTNNTPVRGSWMEQYVRENPVSPICMLLGASVRSPIASRARLDLGFIALAESFKLIQPVEAVASVKAYYGDLGVELSAAGHSFDITLDQAEVILETAGLGDKISNLRMMLADARAGQVVDGVWSTMCRQQPTTGLYMLIHQMPVGRAVIDSLIANNLVEKTFVQALVDTMIGSVETSTVH